jgi:hypothetical protein
VLTHYGLVQPKWKGGIMILQGHVFVGLKLLALAHLGGTALQPVLAGQYLSGHFDALSLHAMIGEAIAWIALIQALAAAICWFNGSLHLWALAAFFSIFALDGLQIHVGHTKSLSIHIPLGASLLTISFATTVWLWRQTTARSAVGTRT